MDGIPAAITAGFGAPRPTAVLAVLGYRIVSCWLPLAREAVAYLRLRLSLKAALNAKPRRFPRATRSRGYPAIAGRYWPGVPFRHSLMPTPPHKSRMAGFRPSKTKEACHAQATVHLSILLGVLAITAGILALAWPASRFSPWTEGAEMIMHPARWRRGRLAAACCAASAALTTPRPPRGIEPVADGTTVTRVALVAEAAAALGMLTGLWIALSPSFIMLPSRYRPTTANRVPMRVVAVTAPDRPGTRLDGEGKTSP
jgi:hypothetical protein